MFSDIVGFTALGERLSAERLVDLLHQIFVRFDALVAAGLEKIKTIGDAYMVVGGLSECTAVITLSAVAPTRSRHARRDGRGPRPRRRPADAAGRHRHRPGGRRRDRPPQIQLRRVGRHREHRQPDGEIRAPGRIHLSAATRDLLGDRFCFEARGGLEVKGKGVMETYFRTPASAGQISSCDPYTDLSGSVVAPRMAGLAHPRRCRALRRRSVHKLICRP